MTTPWTGIFEIRDAAGELVEPSVIAMTQTSATEFRVDASLHYLGDTGLDPAFDSDVRTLAYDADRRTDLASIPSMLRWLEDPYGPHTPAALFHDRFLSEPSAITDVQADLYFRSMLKAVGVPVFKRLIMWTGVVLRTRWVSGLKNKILLVAYVVLAVLGTTALITASLDLVGLANLPASLGGPIPVALCAIGLWLVSSVLWGREWSASLVAGASAPWALPAAALALVGQAVYALLERVLGFFTS